MEICSLLLVALFGSLAPSADYLVTVDRIGMVSRSNGQGRLEVGWGQEIKIQGIKPQMRISYQTRIERWK